MGVRAENFCLQTLEDNNKLFLTSSNYHTNMKTNNDIKSNNEFPFKNHRLILFHIQMHIALCNMVCFIPIFQCLFWQHCKETHNPLSQSHTIIHESEQSPNATENVNQISQK